MGHNVTAARKFDTAEPPDGVAISGMALTNAENNRDLVFQPGRFLFSVRFLTHLVRSLSRNFHSPPTLTAGISLLSAQRVRVLVDTRSHFDTASVVRKVSLLFGCFSIFPFLNQDSSGCPMPPESISAPTMVSIWKANREYGSKVPFLPEPYCIINYNL